MSKILKTHPKSVQAHKDLVLQCLDDKDESIRLRALDLLYGMVGEFIANFLWLDVFRGFLNFRKRLNERSIVSNSIETVFILFLKMSLKVFRSNFYEVVV